MKETLLGKWKKNRYIKNTSNGIVNLCRYFGTVVRLLSAENIVFKKRKNHNGFRVPFAEVITTLPNLAVSNLKLLNFIQVPFFCK